MADQRLSNRSYSVYQSPDALLANPSLDRGASFGSCITPVIDASWGHQSQRQFSSSGRQDEAACDLFPDSTEFQALISNTICTPPRPLRSFDLLASPTSPCWLHNWSSSTILSPFSPHKPNFQDMHSVPADHQAHSYDSAKATPAHNIAPERPASIQRSFSANLPIHNSSNHSGHNYLDSPELCSSDLFVPGLDVMHPSNLQQYSDSSLTCQTPMQQQQRQMSGSLSGNGLHLSHSKCDPVAASAAASAAGIFPSQSTRAPALRRSSTRVPAKRSLEPDFEVMQVVQKGGKGRTARRGSTGPSKAMKPSCPHTGSVKIEAGPSTASSICGLLSPFTLLKPFGDSGSSLEELNKKIRESAEKAQPANSSDDSSKGSGSRHSCSTGSVTMNVLPKGVPVGATSTQR